VGCLLKRCWVLLEWACGKFRNFVRFEVGVGSHVSFWHDLCYGDRSLKQCFPVLFSIVRNQVARVANNLVVQNGVTQWNVIFMRPI
jgi:hypothetical protein